VPQLFPGTGASKWNDPKGHPWTMGFFINYQAEGHIYAAYLLKNKPDGKIGVLYQNDDFGKDYLKGVVDGFGTQAASMIKARKATRPRTRPSTRKSSSCRQRAAMS
jgi:branched-chain amino acid transport system substrate-binding protein